MRFLTQTLIGLCISAVSCYTFAAAQCKNEILVAVIDTGIDSSHDLLKNKLWHGHLTNSNKEIYGWDFVKNAPNPKDDHGHGSHVSGIINQITPCARIMALKYYSPTGKNDPLNSTIDAIYFAVNHGAKIINYSGGGTDSSEKEKAAVTYAWKHGVFFVSAAGNEKTDLDSSVKYYPAAYKIPNIYSVAAIEVSLGLIERSNWGAQSVDYATWGSNIKSSVPGNKYDKMTGTSQATAFVTGEVVNILSENPQMTFWQVRMALNKETRKTEKLSHKVKSGGFLDLHPFELTKFASIDK